MGSGRGLWIFYEMKPNWRSRAKPKGSGQEMLKIEKLLLQREKASFEGYQ
jgi:hypothetical protein